MAWPVFDRNMLQLSEFWFTQAVFSYTFVSTFNVEGSINATGSSAMELLRKSPGVVVDGNDNILLQGKTGVRIYIGGKPSPSPLGMEALLFTE